MSSIKINKSKGILDNNNELKNLNITINDDANVLSITRLYTNSFVAYIPKLYIYNLYNNLDKITSGTIELNIQYLPIKNNKKSYVFQERDIRTYMNQDKDIEVIITDKNSTKEIKDNDTKRRRSSIWKHNSSNNTLIIENVNEMNNKSNKENEQKNEKIINNNEDNSSLSSLQDFDKNDDAIDNIGSSNYDTDIDMFHNLKISQIYLEKFKLKSDFSFSGRNIIYIIFEMNIQKFIIKLDNNYIDKKIFNDSFNFIVNDFRKDILNISIINKKSVKKDLILFNKEYKIYNDFLLLNTNVEEKIINNNLVHDNSIFGMTVSISK